MPIVKTLHKKSRAVKAKTTGKSKKQTTDDRWLETFAILIHDIESPLVSIKYILNLLQRGKLDLGNPLHTQMINSSIIAVERAESIVYDIMAVARAGKVGIPVNMASLQPGAIIEEAIALVAPAANEKKIEINFINNSDETAVKADPKLFKRVMDNLLFNAIRHTPIDGRISVYTDLTDSSVQIRVEDSGTGLDDESISQVFEKYGQISLRADNKHRGVGLGLYFCRLATEGMGGNISAGNHTAGGAVFTVQLIKNGVQ